MQLVYEQDKDGVPEKYTSQVVGFNVIGHLLDTKEPTLVMIENWNNFVLTAEGTMESWQSLEAIRQENENQRVAAETARQEAYAELMDIRNGWDGTVYETAGEAVRNVLTPFITAENEEWIV